MDSIANQIANIAAQLSDLATSLQTVAPKTKTPKAKAVKSPIKFVPSRPGLILKKGHKGAGRRAAVPMDELCEIVRNYLETQKKPVSRQKICDSIGFGAERVQKVLYTLDVIEEYTGGAWRYTLV